MPQMNIREVDAAIAEFDALGRDSFLRKYGFRPSQSYFIKTEQGLYDFTAIAGVADHLSLWNVGPLWPEKFVGDDEAKRHLIHLGYHVVKRSLRRDKTSYLPKQDAAFIRLYALRDKGYTFDWNPGNFPRRIGIEHARRVIDLKHPASGPDLVLHPDGTISFIMRKAREHPYEIAADDDADWNEFKEFLSGLPNMTASQIWVRNHASLLPTSRWGAWVFSTAYGLLFMGALFWIASMFS